MLNFERKNIIVTKWSGKAPKVIAVYKEAILMPSFISIGWQIVFLAVIG